MKTLLVQPDSSLSIAEAGVPKPGPKQALTKTIANGICGSDITIIQKAFKGMPPEMYPLMLGHENVGRVIEVGGEVRSYKVGDVVLLPFVDEDRENVGPYGSGWGACSEYGIVTDAAVCTPEEMPVVAPAQCIVPPDIDPVDAVMIVTFREVLSALRYFGVKPGDPVVIIGSGPVGMTYIKISKLLGADPVIAVVRNETKASQALEFGADIVVNSSEEDVKEAVRSRFPEGVPFVIDAVGNEAVVNQAMGLIADRGMICCYGVPKTEEIHIDFSAADYNWVLNFQQMPRKDEEGAVHEEVIGWIREGKLDLKAFISDYYPFDRAVEAYEDALNKKILKKGIVVFE